MRLSFCDICDMNLVLMGYMGSGKTAIGQQLAGLLKREFIDLDALIESQEGLSIKEIFKQKGAVYFRKRESAVLREVMDGHSDLVIALGGGTPIYGDNLKWINNSEINHSIYLKVSLASLVERLWHERHDRPIIAALETPQELEEFVRKHLFERIFTYQQAHTVFDASDMTVLSAANGIISALKTILG